MFHNYENTVLSSCPSLQKAINLTKIKTKQNAVVLFLQRVLLRIIARFSLSELTHLGNVVNNPQSWPCIQIQLLEVRGMIRMTQFCRGFKSFPLQAKTTSDVRMRRPNQHQPGK